MITNKWLNPYQRSFQQIKAKLIEFKKDFIILTISGNHGSPVIHRIHSNIFRSRSFRISFSPGN